MTGTTLSACVAQPCVTSGVPMVGSTLIQCLSDRSYKGWSITLDSPPAERVITDPLATPTGAVFYTTFAPSPDACKFGGSSYLWAVNYETGGSVGGALTGKALLQVSTGAIEEINLKTAFSEEGGRRTIAIDGVPPTGQGLAVVVPPKPIGKIMHIRKQ
jgi:type IV pilus assembly protein PilY1